MYTVKLMNEFLHGAVWVYKDGLVSSYELIDNDPIIAKLNEETEELYDSFFEFNSHEEGCYFNKELQLKTKEKMYDLIDKIKRRLEEINDGSFIVEDYIDEEYEN